MKIEPGFVLYHLRRNRVQTPKSRWPIEEERSLLRMILPLAFISLAAFWVFVFWEIARATR